MVCSKTNALFQINIQGASKSKSGITNAGFDVEKGGRDGAEKTGDKLAGNYVPYGQYPGVTGAKQEEVREEKEEQWKANYVPYQEDNKEESK